MGKCAIYAVLRSRKYSHARSGHAVSVTYELARGFDSRLGVLFALFHFCVLIRILHICYTNSYIKGGSAVYPPLSGESSKGMQKLPQRPSHHVDGSTVMRRPMCLAVTARGDIAGGSSMILSIVPS